ncbi:MAG: hypothetical protein UV55_C0030G0006 [Candidatus Gottesmanbacteria bacterium GW2011_GWC1_43_10]|nr:MAG: hypothetical protein UV04_C0023G0009 [Candidatus Gottesmanbacteria bacterium GW2011_GWA2_42_16]KKS80786.1 MAG: hypothetical protein UV55_C0030G0006 [Candidatus Gottesmanbacteria bacterium GW2011_GWC1_43_10]OGG07597.1 MAG: hypothetical protein A2699_02055 [Candidatus Gottesmanbacteria bacterium RIFCSPHIGHO2_01_FULL_43_15]OGG28032.1 MAG: hypothetical protein A3A59_06335 [Candidatus Gottesmanbacteria bacterium RIFCSPLOWO2_01_FULL_42_10]HCM37288.1 hypothetical protein [Patescibacteria group
MSVFILFGLPGTGKTYVGKIFQKSFGFYFYDGDLDLSSELKRAIKSKSKVTDAQRGEFFAKLSQSIKNIYRTNKNLVVAQTFIKEKYRKSVLKELSDIQFVLVNTDTSIRERRLSERKENPLDMAYARKMCLNFEKPTIAHQVMVNNASGEKDIKRQIRLLLDKKSSV